MRLGVLKHPILVVSPWFEARRTEYQDALLHLSRTGDWDRWVQFFATGVDAAARTTHERIDGLLTWQEQTLDQLRAANVSGLAGRVAGDLIGGPILRANQVAVRYGVSHQGAMNALRKLADLDVLTTQSSRGRITFRAEEVIRLLGQ
jgi:Fic family protein